MDSSLSEESPFIYDASTPQLWGGDMYRPDDKGQNYFFAFLFVVIVITLIWIFTSLGKDGSSTNHPASPDPAPASELASSS